MILCPMIDTDLFILSENNFSLSQFLPKKNKNVYFTEYTFTYL